jgi:hypothetical protein
VDLAIAMEKYKFHVRMMLESHILELVREFVAFLDVDLLAILLLVAEDKW